MNIIPQAWIEFVPSFKNNEHLILLDAIAKMCTEGKKIYPPKNDIFNALKYTSPINTKVIIMGQDPYHRQGQAHGLAFSVPEACPIPPSLKNIFKEIQSDIYNGLPMPNNSGNLIRWAEQGVLLLNTILSVEEGKAGSHAKLKKDNITWNKITLSIVESLAKSQQPLVVLLWGNHAHKYAPIFTNKEFHLILQAAHPSPLSANRGFLGCSHFSQTNKWLKAKGRSIINW